MNILRRFLFAAPIVAVPVAAAGALDTETAVALAPGESAEFFTSRTPAEDGNETALVIRRAALSIARMTIGGASETISRAEAFHRWLTCMPLQAQARIEALHYAVADRSRDLVVGEGIDNTEEVIADAERYLGYLLGRAA